MKTSLTLAYLVALVTSTFGAPPPADFNPKTDLLSLHYDHAPDKDDGQSAAADRMILETLQGKDWIREHVVAVSGAYGKNKKTFNPKSDAVMDACWKNTGGWIAADADWGTAVKTLTKRWKKTLAAGGDIWVKEGGQSDITAAVIKRIQKELRGIDTNARIHVVQHSDWNENQTTGAALAYTKQHAHYIRIPDANAYLNVKGGEADFVKAALAHPKYGPAWKAAFEYYPPKQRLDFSDTGELMYILGLGEMGIDAVRKRFL